MVITELVGQKLKYRKRLPTPEKVAQNSRLTVKETRTLLKLIEDKLPDDIVGQLCLLKESLEMFKYGHNFIFICLKIQGMNYGAYRPSGNELSRTSGQ